MVDDEKLYFGFWNVTSPTTKKNYVKNETYPKYDTSIPPENSAKINQTPFINKLNKIEKRIIEYKVHYSDILGDMSSFQNVKIHLLDEKNMNVSIINCENPIEKCCYCEFVTRKEMYEVDKCHWNSTYLHYLIHHNIAIDENFAKFLIDYTDSVLTLIPDENNINNIDNTYAIQKIEKMLDDERIEREKEEEKIKQHDETLLHIGFWVAPECNVDPWKPKYTTTIPKENSATLNQSKLTCKLYKIEQCINIGTINGKYEVPNCFCDDEKCHYCDFFAPIGTYELDKYMWTSIYLHYVSEHNIAINNEFANFLDKYSEPELDLIPDEIEQPANQLSVLKLPTLQQYIELHNACDNEFHDHEIEHNDSTKKYIGFFKKIHENNYPWDKVCRLIPVEEKTRTLDQSKLIIKLLKLQYVAKYRKNTNIMKCVFCIDTSQNINVESSSIQESISCPPQIDDVSKINTETGEFSYENFVWSECYIHYLVIHNVRCDPEFETFVMNVELK